MEPEGDPGGQVDTGDRFGGEVLGGEEDQVRGAAAGVVDIRHDVALVLASTGPGRSEDRLARSRVLAESCVLTVPDLPTHILSYRTVGAYLYQIFPKLGITSRAALRDALADLPEPDKPGSSG